MQHQAGEEGHSSGSLAIVCWQGASMRFIVLFLLFHFSLSFVLTVPCFDLLIFLQLLEEQDEHVAAKRDGALAQRRKKARQAAEGNNEAVETALCQSAESLEEDLASFGHSSTAKLKVVTEQVSYFIFLYCFTFCLFV